MTGPNDLDRMLASYLEEGPRRAPDGAMDAAVAFAVAHPRRRDPLLFLKPEVMARRSSMFSPQLVWVAAVIALTLGAIAAIAVGTRPSQQPVVPPSVVTSRLPSIAPIPSPTIVEIELVDPNNEIRWPVTITDESGTLVTAEPEVQQDVPPVDRIEATNDQADPTRVELVWTFCGGPSPHELTIDETGLVWRLSRPVCSDTLGGADQRMTLVFSEPVDASSLDVQLVEIPG
jgi:hypothetical protein